MNKMLKDQKTKKYIIIGYIAFLILGAFYVKTVLSSDNVKVLDERKKEPTVKVKQANVTLIVDNGITTQEYKAKMKNVDSVIDLISNLRESQNLMYEKVDYTFGSEIDEVNSVKANDQKKWRVFENDKDVTLNIGKTTLVEGTIYTLKLITVN